jgi:ATP-binding cassette, subfamily B, bacterial
MNAGSGIDRNVVGRIVAFSRPYWLKVAGTFLLSMAAVPLTLLTPLPLKIAVDSVIGSKPLPGFLNFLNGNVYVTLAAVALLLVAITFLLYAQGMAVWLASTYLGERLVLDFRAALFRHAQRLSLAYHDRTGTTDSVFRIQYDAECLQHVLIDGIIPLLSALLTAAAVVTVTAWLNWQLALVSLIVCPILYLVTVRFGRRLRGRWYEVKDIESSAMSVVQEALAAGRVVKAFGQEEYEQRRFVHRASRRLKGQLHIAWLQSKFDLAIGVTVAAGTAAVLLLGVIQVKGGHLSTGELLMVLAYQAQIYLPLRTISKKVADLQSGLASAGRAFALLDQLPEVTEKPHAKRLERAWPGRAARNFAGRGRRHSRWNSGQNRRRQDDVREPVNAFLRPQQRSDTARRDRFARLQACRLTQPVRDGAARNDALLHDDSREHRLWQAGRDGRGDP